MRAMWLRATIAAMNYDHEKLLADFARRTLHNLRLIREIQTMEPEREAYEVTQLINSMLGLLVFPKERYLNDIPPKTLDELKREGWPIPDVRPGYTQAQSLRDFLRLMRNAIAHFNVEFLPDQKNEINGVRIWNKSNGTKTWEVELSLEQIEAIALRFIALLTGEDEMSNQTNASLPTAIEWRRVFIRSGFNFREAEDRFNFMQENAQTERFLRLVLVELNQIRDYKGGVFSPTSLTVDEAAWLAAIEKLHTGSEAGLLNLRNLDLQIMDTYMAAIVRWVNAAGIKTTFSCDGHKNREPRINLADRSQEPLLDYFLRVVSNGEWLFKGTRFYKRGSSPIQPANGATDYDRSWLLDVAEKLHQHQVELRQFVEAGEKLASAARG
jgi:hypothetical protein